MFTVYILKSLINGSYYIGQTSDCNRRLAEHNSGEVMSTRFSRPWILVYSEEFDTRNKAIGREKEIKRRKKRRYIEKLISERSAAR